MPIRSGLLKLCLITNIKSTPMPEYGQFLEQAVHGGITMVQLREKSEDMQRVGERAFALKKILQPFKIPLIINDYVDLACEIDADGVHIGRNDMPALKARSLLGDDKIIGISIESLEEIDNVNELVGPYYVTASAVYPSKMKPDCKKIWGLDGLKQLVNLSKHPVTCIGGIRAHNAKELLKVGASGIAVISAIHDSSKPCEAALNLRQAMEDE